MPLHLLAKKSWHVYNADNVARVRRDEAAARAREEDEERQRRDRDADERARLLRGEAPDDTEDGTRKEDGVPASTDFRSSTGRGPRRERKRRGEDDTDFEMRLAREKHEEHNGHGKEHGRDRRHGDKEPALVDSHGHIDLIGQAATSSKAQAQAAAAPRGELDDAGLRFSDAAGRAGFGAWYTGDEPPKPERRARPERTHDHDHDRQRQRRPPIGPPPGSMGADPLAAMKQAAAAMRALKQERAREADEQRRALASLKSEQEPADDRRDRHRHSRDHRDRDHRDRDHRDRDRDHRDRRDRRHDRGRDREHDRHGHETGQDARRDRHEHDEHASRHRRRSRSPRQPQRQQTPPTPRAAKSGQ